ncbi:MAG TPA: sulfatase, partial [Niabella sp.]|nr:sulfatase [Niabella sp.]
YPPVAVTAAAVLYGVNKSSKAASCLKQYVLGDNQHWALMGVNLLLYIKGKKDKEPFVETVQQCRQIKGRSYAAKAACMDFLGSLNLVPNDINHRQ